MICFPFLLNLPVEHYFSAQRFLLVRADSLAANDDTRRQLVAICNEPEIYMWLFAASCGGKPYSVDDAQAWIDWAYGGWRDNTHFAFAVLDPQRKLVAACDIKSDALDNAEIGYWCSTSASGIMTNALRVMIDVALHAGFRSFIAYTRPGNFRSIAVLSRLGFSHSQVPGDDGRFLHHYRGHAASLTAS